MDTVAETLGKKGVIIQRMFSKAGIEPLDEVKYDRRTSVITEPDGTVVFEMKDIEVPESWTQLATDIIVSKYFRKAGVPKTGSEKSARQVVYRISHTLRVVGEQLGYFLSKEGADTFEGELSFMLINQYGAFNSPVWFNCGLYQQYGIKGSGGNYAWDFDKNDAATTEDSYSRPQCSACFIQSVDDDLMSIFELAKNEAKLFKFGSGTGTNFSKIRGKQEKLSGGGKSSGLMSFLEVLDKGAGATKSGGTTRRAAKMVCLNMDHPEIVDFINWKVKEERKVKALIEAGYPSDFNGEAYHTVSGQNSNNSVRLPDKFMKSVEEGAKWQTTFRTTGEVCEEYGARDLMQQICKAAWACADPGVQFDDTINNWHTCANTDRIYASNPCSEYMFLDNTACNLASINLMKFLDEDGTFDVEAFRHACKIFTTAQEIVVDFASYPTKIIGKNSHIYRTLGLGYANLGTLLMVKGIPYDSEEGRQLAAGITALMCGEAYLTSAEIASVKGAFGDFEKNREPMLKVISMHLEHARKVTSLCQNSIRETAIDVWEQVLEAGKKYGYRNAQVTVIAPTGTIGLLMDCDTTGVEPDYALVKWKKLAGGGYFKIVNQSLPRALNNLGYKSYEIESVINYIIGHGTLEGAPHVNSAGLRKLGISEPQIKEVEDYVASIKSIDDWTPHVNPKALSQLGLSPKQIKEAQQYVGGTGTVEGAPYLREEHYAIFDCANTCGIGKRFIAPMGHVKMMAAVQPFISGAISKTVNLPDDATVEDIEQIYLQGWNLGLKAIALYRDGSKMSQPLSSGSKSDLAETESTAVAQSVEIEQSKNEFKPDIKAEVKAEIRADGKRFAARGEKRKLPQIRKGVTVESRVAGHKIFLRTGEYEDGTIGEIFIDMHKEGAAFRSLMNCFAISVSLGLQHGAPLEKFVDAFIFTRFEPHGMTDHPNIKSATSVVDFVFRVLGMSYLGRTDFVHVPPESISTEIAKVPNGNDNGYAQTQSIHPEQAQLSSYEDFREQTEMQKHLAELGKLMGDAPPCTDCGHTTVRNGTCYRCLNCGNSMGCS